MSRAASETFELAGIDGRNPLGFLAALGTLRLLASSPDLLPAISWRFRDDAVPRPLLHVDGLDRDALVERLVGLHLARDLEAEFGWTADIMRISRNEAREQMLQEGTALSAEMARALVAELPLRREGDVPYTPFRLVPRVGRSRFVSAALKVATVVTPADFEHALFEEWRYRKSPGSNSLRLDPGARIPARAYAREAPTNFGPLGVPGAIALAVVGLSLFPLQPLRRGVACRGFAADRLRLHWPIWTDPLSLPAARVLLGLPALYADLPDPRYLERHGIAARVVARRERRGSDDEALSWGTIDFLVSQSGAAED